METLQNRRFRHAAFRRLGRIAALLVVAAALSTGCSFQKPTAKLDGMRISGISFQKLDAVFDVAVKNPNPIGLRLSGYDYDFQVEGNTLLSGDQTEKVQIAKNARSIVSVPVSIHYDKVWSTIQAANGKDKVSSRFKGGVKLATPIGDLRIPFNAKGKIPVLKVPAIKMAKIDVGTIDISGAHIELKVKMKNPNNTRLGVKDLNWGLSIADSQFLDGSISGSGTLDGGETRTISIPVKLSFAELGRSLFHMLQRDQVEVRFRGKVRFETAFGDIALPFDEHSDVKLR